MSGASSVVGVILAAGLSTRMGTPKALLEWRGLPLVVYQARQLAEGGADTVLVVTGHEAEAVESALAGSEVRAVRNVEYRSGRASSVRAAAAVIDDEAAAVVLLNVDQPRRAETIASLLQAHRAAGGSVTVPNYHGKRGHPIVLSGRLLPELRRVSEEDEGLRAVVRRHADARVEVALEAPDVLLDLNDPAAYEAARRDWGSAG
jgi:CTP:molybdopterin cytidylyltransferase MocA